MRDEVAKQPGADEKGLSAMRQVGAETNSRKSVQLFILPYAGGSAAAFKGLAGLLSSEIDTVIIEYPGRGRRIQELFADSWKMLVEDTKLQILDRRNRNIPFAVLGYSMGTALAYELIQHGLEEKPVHAFLCARGAGDRFDKSAGMATHEEFILEMRMLGGIDKRIENDMRLIKYFTKPAYEDYRLLQEYIYQAELGMPECNFTVFYCEKDTPYSEVAMWKTRTTGTVTFHEMGKNHFFLLSDAEKMADVINRFV